MSMDAVLTKIHDGGWAELVLNRPERRNAIEGTLAQAMHLALDSLERAQDVRAVVLRGANGAFCSGLDLKAFGEQPTPEWVAQFPSLWDRVHTQLLGSRKAWVVALERYAINGGAVLALAGDLMVCGESAFLQVGEVAIGMAAPRNAAWLALRHGEAVAAKLCLMGERVSAGELLRLGLASEVVTDADVMERARAIARGIGSYPAQGVAGIKSAMRAATMRMPAEQWLAACARHDALARPAAAIPAPAAPSR